MSLLLLLLLPHPSLCQDGGIDSSLNSVEDEDEGDLGTSFCMEKVEVVEELEWDTKVKCHHSYRESCYRTYETTYVTAKASVEITHCVL